MDNPKISFNDTQSSSSISRRRFMAGVGGAALSFTIIKPHLVGASEANSKINIGMIGCGDRGSRFLPPLFLKHGKYSFVAGADYFQDKVDVFGKKYNIPKKHLYTGLSCYRRLLEQKLDAVAIISPPYFHAEQTAAAIDAGCHVYLAKPIAVDVPGCNSIAQSGKKATANNLCLIVDFQTRANPMYKEALKRTRGGALGTLAFGQSDYQGGGPWNAAKPDNPEHPEYRLRNWLRDKVLSGDTITEQFIHAIDVDTWIMNQAPLCAVGTGGRKVRPVGTTWDHFVVVFEYPGNVGISFRGRQFNGHGAPGGGIFNRMYGSNGVLETAYGGKCLIRGKAKSFFKGGSSGNIFTTGAVTNIATFYDNIVNNNFANSTVAPSVRSTLTTILGRTAAYTGEKTYWADIIRKNEKLDADFIKKLKV